MNNNDQLQPQQQQQQQQSIFDNLRNQVISTLNQQLKQPQDNVSYPQYPNNDQHLQHPNQLVQPNQHHHPSPSHRNTNIINKNVNISYNRKKNNTNVIMNCINNLYNQQLKSDYIIEAMFNHNFDMNNYHYYDPETNQYHPYFDDFERDMISTARLNKSSTQQQQLSSHRKYKSHTSQPRQTISKHSTPAYSPQQDQQLQQFQPIHPSPSIPSNNNQDDQPIHNLQIINNDGDDDQQFDPLNPPKLQLHNVSRHPSFPTIRGSYQIRNQIVPLRSLGFTTKWIQGIIQPRVNFGSIATYWCRICESALYTNLESHIKLHSNYLYPLKQKSLETSFSCKSCSLTFTSSHFYNLHIESTTCRGGKNYMGSLEQLLQKAKKKYQPKITKPNKVISNINDQQQLDLSSISHDNEQLQQNPNQVISPHQNHLHQLNLNDPNTITINNLDIIIDQYIYLIDRLDPNLRPAIDKLQHENNIDLLSKWCFICRAPVSPSQHMNHRELHLNYTNSLTTTTTTTKITRIARAELTRAARYSCTTCCLGFRKLDEYRDHINSPFCSASTNYIGTLTDLIGYEIDPLHFPLPNNCPTLRQISDHIVPLTQYGFTSKSIAQIIAPQFSFFNPKYWCTICNTIVSMNCEIHINQHSQYLSRSNRQIEKNRKIEKVFSCTSCFLTFVGPNSSRAYHNHKNSTCCSANDNYFGPLEDILEELQEQFPSTQPIQSSPDMVSTTPNNAITVILSNTDSYLPALSTLQPIINYSPLLSSSPSSIHSDGDVYNNTIYLNKNSNTLHLNTNRTDITPTSIPKRKFDHDLEYDDDDDDDDDTNTNHNNNYTNEIYTTNNNAIIYPNLTTTNFQSNNNYSPIFIPDSNINNHELTSSLLQPLSTSHSIKLPCNNNNNILSHYNFNQINNMNDPQEQPLLSINTNSNINIQSLEENFDKESITQHNIQ